MECTAAINRKIQSAIFVSFFSPQKYKEEFGQLRKEIKAFDLILSVLYLHLHTAVSVTWLVISSVSWWRVGRCGITGLG
jgi:hypothetical protein